MEPIFFLKFWTHNNRSERIRINLFGVTSDSSLNWIQDKDLHQNISANPKEYQIVHVCIYVLTCLYQICIYFSFRPKRFVLHTELNFDISCGYQNHTCKLIFAFWLRSLAVYLSYKNCDFNRFILNFQIMLK